MAHGLRALRGRTVVPALQGLRKPLEDEACGGEQGF